MNSVYHSLGRTLLCGALGLCFSFQRTANADILVSVTGPTLRPLALGGQGLAASWHTAQPFEDVSVTVDVYGAGLSDARTAYLMTRVGAGTTIADEVAETAFTFPEFTDPHTVTLFNDLTLS